MPLDDLGLKPLAKGRGKGKRQKPKPSRPDPEQMLVRAAARLGQVKDPSKRELVMSELGQAFQGMSPAEINRIAAKANLLPDDVLSLTRASRPRGGPSPAFAAALDIIDRPVQAVKGAVVESGLGLSANPLRFLTGQAQQAAFRGAKRGLLGEERYPGLTAGIVFVTGMDKERAAETRESLPAPVRVAGDIAVDTIADPTNYVTLGAGAAATNAARTAAKRLAGDAAEAAVLSTRAQAIYDDILRRGVRALTAEQRAQLPPAILRRLNRAQGGIRVAGMRVPGSQRLPLVGRKAGRQFGPRSPAGVLSEAEQAFRPRAAVRAAERGGVVPAGTTQSVENLQARLRAAQHAAEVAERRAERAAREAAGEAVGLQGRRAVGRAGRRALADADLDAVREALDVRGGPEVVGALPDVERNVARALRRVSDEDFEALVRTGRLTDDLDALRAAREERVAAQFDPLIERVDEQIARLEQAVSRMRAPRAAAQAARVEGRAAQRLRVLENLKRSAEARRAALLRRREQALARVREPIDQSRYFPHYPSQEAYELGALVPDHPSSNLSGRGPGFLRERAYDVPASEVPPLPDGSPSREMNPVVAIGRHARETTLDTARVAAFDELSRLAPVDGKPMVVLDSETATAIKAQPGWRKDYAEVTVPVTRIDEQGVRRTVDEKVLVRAEVAKEFQRVVRADMSKIRAAAAYLNALWARYATATTGFISRNVLQGNLYLGMVLAGANDPRSWGRAFGMWLRTQRGINLFGDPFRYLDDAERTLLRGALENGAVESGFLQTLADASDAALRRAGRVGRVIRGSRFSPLSPNFAPIAAISQANQWAENWSRLAVYVDMVKKGYTPPEAAAIARKYLIDYRDLAPANDMLRIVNPFVTWVYKSAPLLIGEYVRDPKKVNIPMAILRAVGEEGERSEGTPVMPEWMRKAGGVTLPRAIRERLPFGMNETPQVFLPDLPIHSTNETLRALVPVAELIQGRPGAEQRLGRELWNLLGFGGVPGGLLKSTVEAAAQQQLFSGRRFEPGQRVPTPYPLNFVLGDTMPWEQWNTLSALVPVTSRLAVLAPRSEYDADSRARRAVSTVSGFGIFPNTEQQRRSEMYRRLAQLNAVIRSLEDQGIEVPTITRTHRGRNRRGGFASLGV